MAEYQDDLEHELDPAFQEHMPSHAGAGGFDMELEMNMGMGSSMDHLDSELDAPSSSTRTPRQQAYSSFADELGGAERDDSALHTPRRKGAAGGPSPRGGGHGVERFSLADELASTISPSQKAVDRRRLVEEFGLDLDEDEDDEPMLGQNVGGSRNQQLDDPFMEEAALRGLGQKASQTTLADQISGQAGSLGAELGAKGMDIDGMGSPALDDDAQAAEDEAHYEAASAALSESLRTTDLFLNKLRGLSTSDKVESSSSRAASNALEDTSSLERLASDVARQMYDLAREREDQVRELREIERAFARPEPEWQAALAELEDLPERDEEADFTFGLGSGAVSASNVGRGHRRDLSEASSTDTARLNAVPENDEPEGADEHTSIWDSEARALEGFSPTTRNAPLSNSGLPGAGPPASAPAPAQLAHLQAVTGSLIHSLGAMHEHAQVHRAAMNDAGRRLRSLRTVLGGWRAEMDGVARSMDWIARWEGTTPLSADGTPEPGENMWRGKRPDDIKQWTGQQMERFEKVLGDAELRARELLTPVSLPALPGVEVPPSAELQASA